jgi:hypothetical protein
VCNIKKIVIWLKNRIVFIEMEKYSQEKILVLPKGEGLAKK